MSSNPQDDYLEQVKAEVRVEADAARARAPLPRRDPPPRAQQRPRLDDGIERERLDYAIGDLTGPDYRAFIDHAFRALLKRPPDDAGSEMQTRLLAAGAAKAEVLGNLRWSPEGRRIGARVRGLLPRYVLAKLTRAPILGYCIEWSLALAGLPLLLRHQRAADTSIAARFGATADAQQRSERSLEELKAAHAAFRTEHDRRSDVLGEDIRRILLRLDELEHRAATLEQRADVGAHETIELRHYVHAANHWVASLQRSLVELEDIATAERLRADELAAVIDEGAEEIEARSLRHAGWAAALVARLPAGARVLDLGSGDGTWLEALAARGLDANGVEANAALVARAQQRGVRIALGDPLTVLTRCADADLDGITIAAAELTSSETVIACLLGEAQRALKAGAYLLLRIECEPHRISLAGIPGNNMQRCTTLLAAAGFAAPTVLAASVGGAVLVQRAP